MGRSVCVMTSAPPGSGKTFMRAAVFLTEEWLPNEYGVHYSNFPLKLDALEVWAGEHGIDPATVRERIRLIPESELQRWLSGDSGPWDTFEGADLTGAHIAIDEAHNFWPTRGKAAACEKMVQWLAEIRHRGATVELITQHPGQVNRSVVRACGEQIILTNLENEFEPVLGCRLGDWFQLRARWLTGKYTSWIRQEKLIQWGTGYKAAHTMARPLDSALFPLYDSYSKPVAGGEKGEAPKQPWERFGRLRILIWFYLRNWLALSWRMALVCVLVWALSGGLSDALRKIVRGVRVGGSPGVAASTLGKSLPPRVPGGPAVPGMPSPLPPGQVETAFAVVGPDGKIAVETRRGSMAELFADLARGQAGLVGEIAKRDQVLSGLGAEVKDLKARLGEYGCVTLINDRGVRLASGDFFSIGEEIDCGEFKGLSVARVDKDRSTVLLSDGRLVRLGNAPERVPAKSSVARGEDQTGVPTAVRSGAGAAAGGGSSAGSGAGSVPSPINASGGLGAPPLPGNGSNGDSGGRLRGSNGGGGSSRGNGFGDIRRVGGASGCVPGYSGQPVLSGAIPAGIPYCASPAGAATVTR